MDIPKITSPKDALVKAHERFDRQVVQLIAHINSAIDERYNGTTLQVSMDTSNDHIHPTVKDYVTEVFGNNGWTVSFRQGFIQVNPSKVEFD